MMASYFLYKNIRTGVFSITHNGLVTQHAPALKAYGVRFNVSEPGRQRVLKERRKNVHAKLQFSDYIMLEQGGPISLAGYREVTYDPYKHTTFVYVDNGTPCNYAQEVICVGGKVYV